MPRYPALRSRNFTLLWVGLIVSNVGTWMQNVAQSWVLYKMTGNDPLYLGWLGLAFAVPMCVVPPFGGVVADRVDRVRLVCVTQSIAMSLAAMLAVLAWLAVLRPWHILATTFLGALTLAFDNPARQSLVADLVPPEHLQNAVSLNSATFTGAALVGPGLAGLLLDVLGAGSLFALNALSFLAVLFALFALREVPKHAGHAPRWRDAAFGGFAFAWRTRPILVVLVLSAIAAIAARSYPQLYPIFADDVFHVGARGYGGLLSAGGTGALIAAFVLSSMHDLHRKRTVMLWSGAALCVTLVLFAITRVFVVALALVVVMAMASTVFTTMIATLIQLEVPRELRGRVISLYVATLIGLPSLGALGVAALARVLGQSHGGAAVGAPRAIIAGAATFLVVLTVCARSLLARDSPSGA